MPYTVVTPKHVKKDAPLAKPLLTYHGGLLIQNAEVVTIYWGSAWANDPLRTQLDEFFNFVLQSSLLDQLAEYSVPGQTIGRGSHVQSALITSDPPNPISDGEIQAFLSKQIASGGLLEPNANTIYFFFMPANFTVSLDGELSCQAFCGYHNMTPEGFVYAVDTYDDCAGCQFAGDLLGSSTAVASHELCEAITDPHLDGWFDDNSGDEIGDICEPQTKMISVAASLSVALPSGTSFDITVNPTVAVIDGTATVQLNIALTPQGSAPPPPTPPPPTPQQNWTVQKEWSNAAGACV